MIGEFDFDTIWDEIVTTTNQDQCQCQCPPESSPRESFPTESTSEDEHLPSTQISETFVVLLDHPPYIKQYKESEDPTIEVIIKAREKEAARSEHNRIS